MGRIVASVKIENLAQPDAMIRCDALNEVLFVDMEPENGDYEPLIGYVILEQSQAAVDTLSHRLIPVKRMDLK